MYDKNLLTHIYSIGGSLLTQYYNNYAYYLVRYVQEMGKNGPFSLLFHFLFLNLFHSHPSPFFFSLQESLSMHSPFKMSPLTPTITLHFLFVLFENKKLIDKYYSPPSPLPLLLFLFSLPFLQMEPDEQTNFIKNNLGPVFEKYNISTKIVIYDHNADRIDYPLTVLSDPDVSFFKTYIILYDI